MEERPRYIRSQSSVLQESGRAIGTEAPGFDRINHNVIDSLRKESVKMKKELSLVVIIGAGTMGHSLALLFAHSGRQVRLIDLDEAMPERARQLISSELETLQEAGNRRTHPKP